MNEQELIEKLYNSFWKVLEFVFILIGICSLIGVGITIDYFYTKWLISL